MSNYTRHFECGCKIVVIGELTNATIIYCAKHEYAPAMYEALKALQSKFKVAALMAGLSEQVIACELSQSNEALSLAEEENYE
ncbi:hypothetical protein LCGC14_0365850 [marine sediment metagenome]|uniref:Uncharacterized protein n=1 Tax=marine sediment metagenome TaxID=412755 RepID=A0A0F9WF80_9ZZZZ